MWIQTTYRSQDRVIRLLALSFSFVCILFAAQKTTPPSGVKPDASLPIKASSVAPAGTAGAPAKKDPTPPSEGSAIDQKQQASLAAMNESLAKQQASIKTQIASTVTTDSFFSTGWTTAPAFQPPILIPTCSAMSEDDLKPLIADAAKTHDLKPELIRAVIRAESASYPCAVSEKGALGLMQLMPETADQFNVDPLDPKQNVTAGSQYLKQLMTRYKGDLKLVLSAYNAGPGAVDAHGGKVPDIPETTAYVDSILKDLNQSAATPRK